MEKPREESQILEDLATLAASPGYVHAVAHICHRDNVIHIGAYALPRAINDRQLSKDAEPVLTLIATETPVQRQYQESLNRG